MAIPGRQSSTTASATQQAQAATATSQQVPAADKFNKAMESIRPVKQTTAKQHCALFWGKTKTGKTTLAADYPKPLLLLDIYGEHGTASIQNEDGVFVKEINTWEDFEYFLHYLRYGDHEFKSVVIDTITKLQDLALAKVLTDRRASLFASKTQKDWGDAAALLRVWLQYYRDLKTREGKPSLYVVFIAQYKESELKDTITNRQLVPNVGAALMPSVAGFVESIVDINGWVHIDMIPLPTPENPKQLKDQLKHCLVVKPDGIYSAGIRLPGKDAACPDRIVDPTFEKIDAIMNPKKAAQ